ncbi:MAG: LysM domain-containing protein [Dokdonella sp.]|jgi:LysM repeat protein|uniref:LysM peptidoglycan-binding domain-containing protein n=1 Tax=Dokdonella sp. TaxID=2291710 RepID=UPI001B641ACB|nr:LysM domain-containing protein [Dokdonella sp.]MCC6440488.1 LysM peptidoglycan-binding domain-containing protein [Rhodanobacteraceae bacterium]MBK8123519.1 LysM peptidoglycan-binding domain-containing protein [Dokdonella sp.]MBP6326462.1 LysM peptidoglycan-binding domain-containing protein [Dokdonella sp.]MBP6329531.1 LysM peptidoglycan-binding domain-containing protein [Dokdonella sp.]HNV08351.1 LysM domain-containing protein [Dokdonella sp.]
MLKKLLSISAGLLLTVSVFAAQQWADNAPQRYIVKKGDTLWDISAKFLIKPWHWPEIWHLNQKVRNPHLIYPGDELVISGNGVTHGEGSFGPHIRETSLEDAVKPIPLSLIKQFLKNARVVDEDALRNAPHVVAIEESRLRGSAGQLVYIRGLDAMVGDKFAIVRPMGRYHDMPPEEEGQVRETYRQERDGRQGRQSILWRHGPQEWTFKGRVRFLGYEVLEFGTVQVTRVGNPSSALVTYSDFEVREGDYIMPLDATPYDDQFVPHPPAQAPDANMRVIAFTDALNAVGPLQVVALSRGSEDGVDNGTTYAIYTDGETVHDDTDYPKGKSRSFFHPRDSKVQLPPEFIGHVMVFRTFKRVSYGLVMDSVRPVHVGDFMHDPDSTP